MDTETCWLLGVAVASYPVVPPVVMPSGVGRRDLAIQLGGPYWTIYRTKAFELAFSL
jgi:hypothetical protein